MYSTNIGPTRLVHIRDITLHDVHGYDVTCFSFVIGYVSHLLLLLHTALGIHIMCNAYVCTYTHIDKTERALYE